MGKTNSSLVSHKRLPSSIMFDGDLLRALRVAAAVSGKPMREIIDQALRKHPAVAKELANGR